MQIDTNLLEKTIEISHQAGAAILEVYNRTEGYETQTKSDSSPVTEADLAAHHILHPALTAIDPTIPVLSEESTLPAFAIRSSWSRYWIIDPLDGTKEFIKRNGEFTVNIALIEDGIPVLGVVFVPVLGITYAGTRTGGAIKRDGDTTETITVRKLSDREQGSPVNIVASRSHGSDAVEACVKRLETEFGAVERQSMGSSLKLCLVAEGKADLYPRLAPTSEWDTAAAQAVVEAAGGITVDSELAPLRYNQKDDILNPHFYVIGDSQYDWAKLLLA